jgi:anthranilate phosphoribosyltransferase
MNAGAGLVVAGKVSDLADGIRLAAEVIDSGKSWAVLETLVKVSNR